METLAYDCGNPVQYVCGRYARSTFYLLYRHALLAMTMGTKCVFLKSLTTPRRAPHDTPRQRRWAFRCGGGQGRWVFGCALVCFIPWRRVVRIHMCRWRLYTIRPPGRTLCMTRRGWTRYNLSLCRRTYGPMGMNCWRWSYNPRPPQYNPTGMKWTVRRQMRTPAQLPISQK